ncbi:MAG: hypothetical protein ABI891_14470 [Acidobacteriota bacterium]
MLGNFAQKVFIGLFSFAFFLLLGVASFNLFYLNEKLQMLQLVNEFHNAQINNDKRVINNLLADNFTESGVKLAVGTPDKIYKSDLVNYDYSAININIEANYSMLLSLFSNDNKSVSFVRKLILLKDDDFHSSSFSFYVTYTFEKRADGLKIIKIERKLCI